MKNIFKRTAAAILSLVIVISACSGIISTFATGGNDGSFSCNVDDKPSDLPTGQSVVKSAEFRFKVWNGNADAQKTYTDHATKFNTLTDGDIETGPDFPDTSFATSWGGTFRIYRDGVTSYFDIIYTLDGICDISDILVSNRLLGMPYTWVSYKIYASNQRETLFSGEPVAAYDNTGTSRTQRITTQNFKAKYVAMRITAPTSSGDKKDGWGDSSYYVRMGDFNVYGTKAVDYGKPTEDTEIAFPEAPARSVVKKATAQYSNDTEKNPATLNFSEQLYNSTLVGTEATVKCETDRYVDVILQLKGEQEIHDIYVAHSATADYIPREYALYIGNSEETLFEDDPYYTYKNDNPKATQHYEVDSFFGSYVGMRITKPHADSVSGSDSSVRLREFNVYTDNPVVALKQIRNDDSITNLPTGSSVVQNAKIYYKSPTSSMRVESTIGLDSPKPDPVTKTPFEALIDGDTTYKLMAGGTFAEGTSTPPATKIHVNDGEAYTDIVYTLDGLCDIENIVVIGRNSTSDKKWALSYKLYAGNDEETLFNSDPIYTFDNTSTKNYTQIYSSEELSAKFVAMRITATTAGDDVTSSDYKGVNPGWFYARLTEFNVIGTVDMDARAPVNSGSNVAMPTGQAIVKSAEGYYFDGTDRKEIAITDSKKLYDGSLTGLATGNENDSPMNVSGNYTDIVLELKKEATVTDVYIANAPEAKYFAREYSIYLSTEKDKLFDKAYYTYKTETPSRIQHYEIDPIFAKAKYVGIRIKNAHDSSVAAAESFVRLAEFNVYGNMEPFQKVTNSITHDMPENIKLDGLANLTHPETSIDPVLKAYEKTSDGEKILTSSIPGNTSYDYISDGDTTTQFDVNRPVFAEINENDVFVNHTLKKNRYLDIYYDLRSQADISHIVFASTNVAKLVTGYYEVYLADSKASLFEGEPYVTIDNAGQYESTGACYKMNVISFDKDDDQKDEARFVGVRIYNPYCFGIEESLLRDATTGKPAAYNPVHVRLTEFAVYGKYVDEGFDPKNYVPPFMDTKDIDITKIDEIYGPNLLKPDKLSMYVNGKSESSDQVIAELSDSFAKRVLSRSGEDYAATGGDFPASGYTKPGNLVDFVIKLDNWELTQVNGFIFDSLPPVYQASSFVFASEYQVWIAEERDDLFQGEPNFHYNLRDYDITRGQVVTFPEGKQPKGCYFGFRMINPVYTEDRAANLYLRCSVMYAWGEEAEVKSYPSNVAENMPADVSLLSGDKRTSVTDKNLTVAEQKHLTDSNVTVAEDGSKTYTSLTDTYGTIKTDKKDLEVVYNLCGDIDVSKISVNTLIDSAHGFKTLKVYASDIMQGVFEKDSLIWTSKVGSQKGNITLEKAFKKTKQMRYIRFVFEDTKDNVRIYTLDVIGPDTQKMVTRNLSSSISADNFSMIQNDIETGKSEDFSIYKTMYNDVVDSSDASFISITEGLIGKHTYDMLMYLGDLRTVSSVQLSYLKSYIESWPAKINIYFGETKEEALAKKKPDLVAKESDVKDNKLSFDIKPRLARYVRFEFAKFDPTPYYVDPETGKDVITVTLADIKVMGTRVVGTQTDEKNETLQTYTDKKTNISLTLKRLDQNDIFTSVVGLRVTPQKATNWQMKSLCNNPYFKIVDKKVYKIELVDLFGNAVTDVGGREITLTAKVPKNAESSVSFGDASKRTTISIIDTVEENGILSTPFTINTEGDSKIAFLCMTSETDPYWSTIGELEDFPEGSEEDLMGAHDAEWYNSIHTTDGRFTVTPLIYEIETGVRFTATDVSAVLPEIEYENVLINVPEKSVAVFYDMQITQNGVSVEDGNAYEISLSLPQHVKDNYSEFEVYHSDGMGGISSLYAEEWDGVLTFQTMSMGNIAVVGLAGENAFNAPDGSPVATGEGRTATTAVIMLLTAAAFVITLSAKKQKADQK